MLTAVFVLLVGCSNEHDHEHIGTGGSAPAELPERSAPVFTATDQNGEEFTSSDLKGTPWIASFFFTSCQTVCPALNNVQAQLQKDHGDKVKFVSISTDPDTDTQQAIREYADSYGAQDGTWWMVRMPLESVRSVASEGFAVMDPEEPAMHSTRFIAVDSHMNIAGYFDSEEPSDIERLEKWINSQQ